MCLRPITVKVPTVRGFKYIQTPCRHCMECLKEKQNESAVKIVSELQTCGGKACFLTLTYNNSNLPLCFDTDTGDARASLRIKDVQDWLKRFRSKLAYNNSGKVRVSYCGEYGSRTFRPHYHCIIYGKLVNEIRPALLDWTSRFGFVQAKNINFFETGSTSAVGRYLSKYASKGVFSEDLPIFKDPLGQKLQRPFFRNSRYLGLDYLISKLDYYLNPTSKVFGSFADYLYESLPFMTFNMGAYSCKLPKSWRSLVLYRKFNKKISQYGEYIFEKLKVKIHGFVDEIKDVEFYAQAICVVNDRLFISKCNKLGYYEGEKSLFDNIEALRAVVEKTRTEKLSSSRDFASKLCSFYAKSFC